ncbi:MAG: V-type ATP synthase subunit D [Candidatus Omnitrophica bacterium]|nr:V-type ATP synthase subunit D [Candidatus Omnitrophota bacterium]
MKIKLTKGELKRHRDALKQFQRYLPTLQLKKQQLQIEILHQMTILEKKKHQQQAKKESALAWTALLAEPIDISPWIKPQEVKIVEKSIAGVDIPVFEQTDFAKTQYDLFTLPLWVDEAIESLRVLVALGEEIRILQKGIETLRYELRITTQRVNLFEKIKIPESQEAIRRIKIYLGDQTANAVGRSKIAKRKIEAFELQGAAL